MFSQIRLAAFAAIATVGFAWTVAPADAWQCHGSYQSYGSDYSQPYDQSYSEGYDQNYSHGYRPGYYPRYSYQPQYQDNQGDSSEGYPSDQYSYSQDYSNGANYQDDDPNSGS
jgi:hypothetical protein